MIEKYYTPDLEEFHIGLECESHLIRSGKDLWIKKTINQSDFRDDSYENVFKFKYRVKYLDETDLLELGWKTCPKEIIYLIEGGFWRVRIEEEGAVDLDYIDNLDWEVGFSIYKCQVKNKTEMKKLMQMLNIKPPEQN